MRDIVEAVAILICALAQSATVLGCTMEDFYQWISIHALT